MPEKVSKTSFLGTKKRKLLAAAGLVVVLGIGGFAATKPMHKKTPVPVASAAVIEGVPHIDGVAACGGAKQLLTTSPIKPAELSTIIPLGNFAPPGHVNPTEHMYLNYLLTNGVPQKTNIYSPATMTVTSVTLFDNASSPTPFNSYRIDFAPCQELRGYFIHVMTLNDQLKAAFKEPYDRVQTSDAGIGNPEHTYAKLVNIKLNAGDIIGTGGGAAGMPLGVDIGLNDYRVAAATVGKPSRWAEDSHVVCSLDYLPADTKALLLAKIGDYKGLRNPGEPKCGEVYQDKVGTAQGVWFQKGVVAEGALGPLVGMLTLGHSNFDHAQGVFSMGGNLATLGLNVTDVYGFTPSSSGDTNMDFSKVTAVGKAYCYETTGLNNASAAQRILVELADKDTLRIGNNAKACGLGPWTMPAAYIDYTR